MSDLARRALATDRAFMALGNERFEAEGAEFVRNRDTPDIWDANHVAAVRAATPPEIDRLLARVEREYEGSRHRELWVDPETPPAVEARLVMEGYQGRGALALVLEGEPQGAPKPHDIRPAETEEGWRDYVSLHDTDWREYAQRVPGRMDEETARQMMRSRRAKTPPARPWAAYVDGRPAAYLTSWVGVDGMGQIEDVFTHPDFRGRGLAMALLHHAANVIREEGAAAIVILADPNDTPKEMYAAFGCRPVAMMRRYLKRLDG